MLWKTNISWKSSTDPAMEAPMIAPQAKGDSAASSGHGEPLRMSSHRSSWSPFAFVSWSSTFGGAIAPLKSPVAAWWLTCTPVGPAPQSVPVTTAATKPTTSCHGRLLSLR
eukprot:scaffold56123_cov23-Prasinocladus_malaysianus.AAC.2